MGVTMNNNATLRRLLPIAALGAALAVMLPSRDADAQFRLNAMGGVEGGRNRSLAGTLRVEGTIALIPWVHVGLFGATLHGPDGTRTGYGVGGVAAFRPMLPGTRVDPFGYASVGYQRSPAEGQADGGGVAQLGGGLTIRMIPILDLELRGGYVQTFASDNASGPGWTAMVGLSLHP